MKRLPKTPIATALVLLLATAALPAQDEEQRQESFYRVEAVVFTSAGGRSDAWPADRLADYAAARDPAWMAFARQQVLERERSGDSRADSDLQAALEVVDTLASLESGVETLTETPLYPEPWIALDALSDPMTEAIDRLERSGAYRVHAKLAWHQPLDRSSTSQAVRIHDDRIIGVDWIALTPAGRLLREGRPIETVTQLAPAFRYRLDGRVRLRQRQFMHADIDLEWRESQRIGLSPRPLSNEALLNEGGDFEVHRLDQSRTVRADRFEYFDSAWLGLLLRITAFVPQSGDPSDERPDQGETMP